MTGSPKDLFGFEILAKRDCFGSVNYAKIFLFWVCELCRDFFVLPKEAEIFGVLLSEAVLSISDFH